MALSQKGNGCQGIVHFSLPEVVASGAETYSSKIEAQHFTTETEEGFRSRKDYFVVHRALVQRVWMANHRERCWVDSFPELQETLDASCRAFELNALDFDHVLCD